MQTGAAPPRKALMPPVVAAAVGPGLRVIALAALVAAGTIDQPIWLAVAGAALVCRKSILVNSTSATTPLPDGFMRAKVEPLVVVLTGTATAADPIVDQNTPFLCAISPYWPRTGAVITPPL